uniref:Uncharacterized protein n=1 Tax=Romanomermis culicivorax TaxID=13658 RepID=A0A915I4Y3_ROMCU
MQNQIIAQQQKITDSETDQQFRDNPPLPESVKLEILRRTTDPDVHHFMENRASYDDAKQIILSFLASPGTLKYVPGKENTFADFLSRKYEVDQTEDNN